MGGNVVTACLSAGRQNSRRRSRCAPAARCRRQRAPRGPAGARPARVQLPPSAEPSARGLLSCRARASEGGRSRVARPGGEGALSASRSLWPCRLAPAPTPGGRTWLGSRRTAAPAPAEQCGWAGRGQSVSACPADLRHHRCPESQAARDGRMTSRRGRHATPTPRQLACGWPGSPTRRAARSARLSAAGNSSGQGRCACRRT